ncbi:MAG: ABC transporter substrate-binding protein [Candidatus Thorarchaeota archaeon]
MSQDRLLKMIISLGIILNVGFFSFIAIYPYLYPQYKHRDYWTPPTLLFIGFATNPDTIDPVDCWDVPSFQVQQQVLQGLVQYNASDHPNYPIIGVLASSWVWTSADHIEFNIRPGVTFSDGIPFDADAALWNLKRLLFFCNYSGNLQDNATAWLGFPSSLYYLPDGVTPMIAGVSKVNDMRIAIDLTIEFAPFLDLLCFPSSFMMKPDRDYKYRLLSLPLETLIGTGPYIMDDPVTIDVDVRYHKNPTFWGADEPGWKGLFSKAADVLVLDINEDDVFRNMDMLALKIDYLQEMLPDMKDTFNTSQYHTVYQLGEELCYYYFEFYSATPPFGPRLSVTWRKALQFAINYTYVTHEIYQGLVIRAPAIVPRAMPGHNESVVIVDLDIPTARTIMQSMGYGVGWNVSNPGPDDALWSGANFRTIKVNCHFGSVSNEKMNQMLAQSFNLIGVSINETVRTWSEYLDSGENHPWDMELSYIGLCPDYLDAFNMMDPLLNPASHSNFAHINDPHVNSQLALAAVTTSPAARQQIYMHLQSYLFDVTTPDHEWKYPHAPLFTNLVTYCHSADLSYSAYNVLGDLWCWEMYMGRWTA